MLFLVDDISLTQSVSSLAASHASLCFVSKPLLAAIHGLRLFMLVLAVRTGSACVVTLSVSMGKKASVHFNAHTVLFFHSTDGDGSCLKQI